MYWRYEYIRDDGNEVILEERNIMAIEPIQLGRRSEKPQFAKVEAEKQGNETASHDLGGDE